MKIGIVGAGLNGLACALLLKKFGHEVTVFERSEQPRDSGTGIYVWPQGVQILRFILNDNSFLNEGQPIDSLVTLDRHGKEVHRQLVQMPGHDFPAPAVMFERQRLFNLLKQALGPDDIRYGAACTKVINTREEAKIEINHSDYESFDLVVGTDGISSKVREYVCDSQPHYTGVIASRGVTCFDCDILEENACQIFAHDQARLVTYPLDNSTRFRYWFVAYQHDLDQPTLDRNEMAQRLEGLPAPLLEMIENTREDNILTLPLNAITPGHQWYNGRCVLLGDSIHGMLPTLGYGLTLGLENCFMLAQALNGSCFDDIQPALKRYQTRVAQRSCQLIEVMEQLTDLFYFQKETVQKQQRLGEVMGRFHELARTTAF
ncbi:FAD-dependent oxidoreductase [Photobacterium halotolerans]|uniref:NAD(P)-binding protein n=1 Tax=Photobacterium halotolerans TaxID=265726 RepID=A0A7X4WAN7_9GAMM|nr:NAD(P)/FAD-dependent oxidoreductase [Photobacterium halotolerans]NAW64350.1 NAD(P)-binding protein [Photobacterium halotolerans]